MNKSKLPLIIELLKPSGLSFVLTSMISVFLLLMGTSKGLGSSEPLFELLLGDYASGGLLEITKRDFLDAFTFFDNALLNNFLLVLFWAMVGAIAWYILTQAISLFDEINDDITEVSYKRQGLRHDSHHLVETLTKVFYHFGLLVVIVVYVYFLRAVIAQWLSDIFIRGIGVKLTFSGGAIMLLAIVGMTLALHGLTLLLRLLFARQRLFG